MIRMRLRMNDEAHRPGSKFLEGRHDDVGIFRRLSRIDQYNSFLARDDRYIGVVELCRVNVNAVFDLFELWTELLRGRNSNRKQIKNRGPTAERFRFHWNPLAVSNQLPLTTCRPVLTATHNIFPYHRISSLCRAARVQESRAPGSKPSSSWPPPECRGWSQTDGE